MHIDNLNIILHQQHHSFPFDHPALPVNHTFKHPTLPQWNITQNTNQIIKTSIKPLHYVHINYHLHHPSSIIPPHTLLYHQEFYCLHYSSPPLQVIIPHLPQGVFVCKDFLQWSTSNLYNDYSTRELIKGFSFLLIASPNNFYLHTMYSNIFIMYTL